MNLKLVDRISLWYAHRIHSNQQHATDFKLTNQNLKVLLLVDYQSQNSALSSQLGKAIQALDRQATIWTFHHNTSKQSRASNATINYTDLSLNGSVKEGTDLPKDQSFDIFINLLTETNPRLECFIQRLPTQLKVRFDGEYQKYYNFIVPNTSEDVLQKLNKFIQIYQTLTR